MVRVILFRKCTRQMSRSLAMASYTIIQMKAITKRTPSRVVVDEYQAVQNPRDTDKCYKGGC